MNLKHDLFHIKFDFRNFFFCLFSLWTAILLVIFFCIEDEIADSSGNTNQQSSRVSDDDIKDRRFNQLSPDWKKWSKRQRQTNSLKIQGQSMKWEI